MSDIQPADIFDKVIHQLGDDLVDVLFARLSTITSLLAELINKEMDLAVTDLVLGHPGIYSNLFELQHTIMYFTTLRRHLTQS
jgi:hypothetical protein